MSERMSFGGRREQLLSVMQEVRQGARSQREFTAAIVASRARVSTVWLYKVAGSEFRELRAGLEGGRRNPATEVQELRRENQELRARVREMEKSLRSASLEELSGAFELIERLDEENRTLRFRLTLLERRISEAEGDE